MAHSDKQQPDFSNLPDPHSRLKSQALSRDIEDLNNGLRIDFDQKLSELAELLGRFKALVVAPSSDAANDDSKADTSVTPAQNLSDETKASDTSTPLPGCALENPAEESLESHPTDDSSNTETTPVTAPESAPVVQSQYAPEPARFETGLYKLNCQLYRFRLELDQELEFREEPLHIHFQQESDLSKLFQKLSDKSIEKHPGS